MITFFGYIVPILLGFLSGFFLTIQINIFLSVIVLGIGGWALYETRNEELGGLLGVLVMAVAVFFTLAQWVTILIFTNPFGFNGVDMSWLIRTNRSL